MSHPDATTAEPAVNITRATEFVVVSDWSPLPESRLPTGGLNYETFTDLRQADLAFNDYERGEYPRARAVCIFASRHGVPIGKVLMPQDFVNTTAEAQRLREEPFWQRQRQIIQGRIEPMPPLRRTFWQRLLNFLRGYNG